MALWSLKLTIGRVGVRRTGLRVSYFPFFLSTGLFLSEDHGSWSITATVAALEDELDWSRGGVVGYGERLPFLCLPYLP